MVRGWRMWVSYFEWEGIEEGNQHRVSAFKTTRQHDASVHVERVLIHGILKFHIIQVSWFSTFMPVPEFSLLSSTHFLASFAFARPSLHQGHFCAGITMLWWWVAACVWSGGDKQCLKSVVLCHSHMVWLLSWCSGMKDNVEQSCVI